jgi:hypothetical protein
LLARELVGGTEERFWSEIAVSTAVTPPSMPPRSREPASLEHLLQVPMRRLAERRPEAADEVRL